MDYFISAPANIEDVPADTLNGMVELHGSYEAASNALASVCNLPEQIEAFEGVFDDDTLAHFADYNITLYSGNKTQEIMSGVPTLYKLKDIAAMATTMHGIEYIALDVDPIMYGDYSPAQLKVIITMLLEHECIHVQQMRRGDLVTNTNGITWKGKLYTMAYIQKAVAYCADDMYMSVELQCSMPWEAEAYAGSMSYELIDGMADKKLSAIYRKTKETFEADLAA